MSAEAPLAEALLAEALLAEAKDHLIAGRLDQAAAAFQAAEQADPSRPDSAYGLGFTALSKGLPDQAIAPLERALSRDPNHIKALNALGSALLALGRATEAARCFQQAIDLDQGKTPDFLINHALAALAADIPGDALTSIERILARAPDIPQALALKAQALGALERLEEAVQAIDRAASLAPEDGAIRLSAGRLNRLLRRAGSAMDHLQATAKLLPDSAAAWLELAKAHLLSEDAKSAMDALRRAEAVASTDAAVLAELSFAWERLNDRTAQSRLAEAALAQDPANPEARIAEARALVRSGALEKGLTALRILTEDPAFSMDESLLFLQGQTLDRLGDSARAWEAFEKANAIVRARPETARLAKAGRADLDRCIAAARALPSIGCAPPNPAEFPIFILGFPRSGTTLVDRILGAHPALTLFEEKPLLERAQTGFEQQLGPYPDALVRLNDQARAALRLAYEADTRTLGLRPGTRALDKQPLNMARIGLIQALFPGAIVILVERHPLDAVLSCLMQDFRVNLGNSRFTDMLDTAEAFLQLRTLFQLLAEKTGATVFPVRYETLIENPRRLLEPALNAAGLDWCPELNRYRDHSVSDRIVRSASYAQVSEAINDRSVGRWRSYTGPLAEAAKILTPVISEMGYALP